MDERQKLMRMIRQLRSRISPEVLERAQRAAQQEAGLAPKEPENEASRLFNLALANNGERYKEVLEHLERRYRRRMH